MRTHQVVETQQTQTSPVDSRSEGSGRSSALEALGNTELHLVLRGLTLNVGAQAGVLALSDQEGDVVEVLGTWGGALGLDDLPITLTGPFLARALMLEQAAIEPVDGGSPGDGEEGFTHAAGVSIPGERGTAGALCVAFAGQPGAAREGDTLRRLEAYGQLLSLCLSEPGMLDAVYATAHLDGLTGCLNYSALQNELEREVRRADRHTLSLSCCFIDLDRFKLVNERHGHLYGSTVLAGVARTLGTVVRGEDILGRYGGDEFVAVLPETDEAAAVNLAERVLAMLADPSETGLDEVVDASIGVAQWEGGSSRDALLTAADGALAAAKRAGGARVITASQLAAGARADRSDRARA
jgi:diguanylate cyclase (GGDEF)-like protein